jgi:hypothetical protein
MFLQNQTKTRGYRERLPQKGQKFGECQLCWNIFRVSLLHALSCLRHIPRPVQASDNLPTALRLLLELGSMAAMQQIV